MRAREAYEKASNALASAALGNRTGDLQWMAFAVHVLWQRAKQESLAELMDAYSPVSVVNAINEEPFTRRAIESMKSNETYASFYKSRIFDGVKPE